MAKERLYAPATDLLNAAADAGVMPWELPFDIATLTEAEMKAKMKEYKKKK